MSLLYEKEVVQNWYCREWCTVCIECKEECSELINVNGIIESEISINSACLRFSLLISNACHRY